MSVPDYLALVQDVHRNQGNLQGQRDVLDTASAKRIRARMIDDLKVGAVLPPVVIGLVVDEASLKDAFPDVVAASERGESSVDVSTDGLMAFIEGAGELSIIDGMQRTAAMREAGLADKREKAPPVRVEFWIAYTVAPMVYRMLVLNTGQIPWSVSRQLTVIHAPLLREIESSVSDISRVLKQGERRSAPAEYSEKTLSELYVAFTLRKNSFDAKERIADEFARLDFIERLGDPSSQKLYYLALSMLARFDCAVSRYVGGQDAADGDIGKGRGIFDREPARIGFVVALAVDVVGRPGRVRENPMERLKDREAQLSGLTDRMAKMGQEQLQEFLHLDVLSQALQERVGQVGRFERTLFEEGFRALIEEDFEVPDLEICWRAYP